MTSSFPILEFDGSPGAILKPRPLPSAGALPERVVITFFLDVITALRAEGRLQEIASHTWEDGVHTWYQLEPEGQPLCVFHPGVGAPLAGSFLEITIANGGRKFIACGGAGVLDGSVAVGDIVVPASAVRDEGTSYHYLRPGREVEAHPRAVAAILETLQARGLPYRVSKTWTTDAPFRETPGLIARRRAEGCLTVEMEAAALFAIAKYREVALGQILYGGDDVSGTRWDRRAWDDRTRLRRELLWLAVEACLKL